MLGSATTSLEVSIALIDEDRDQNPVSRSKTKDPSVCATKSDDERSKNSADWKDLIHRDHMLCNHGVGGSNPTLSGRPCRFESRLHRAVARTPLSPGEKQNGKFFPLYARAFLRRDT